MEVLQGSGWKAERGGGTRDAPRGASCSPVPARALQPMCPGQSLQLSAAGNVVPGAPPVPHHPALSPSTQDVPFEQFCFSQPQVAEEMLAGDPGVSSRSAKEQSPEGPWAPRTLTAQTCCQGLLLCPPCPPLHSAEQRPMALPRHPQHSIRGYPGAEGPQYSGRSLGRVSPV